MAKTTKVLNASMGAHKQQQMFSSWCLDGSVIWPANDVHISIYVYDDGTQRKRYGSAHGAVQSAHKFAVVGLSSDNQIECECFECVCVQCGFATA